VKAGAQVDGMSGTPICAGADIANHARPGLVPACRSAIQIRYARTLSLDIGVVNEGEFDDN